MAPQILFSSMMSSLLSAPSSRGDFVVAGAGSLPLVFVGTRSRRASCFRRFRSLALRISCQVRLSFFPVQIFINVKDVILINH